MSSRTIALLLFSIWPAVCLSDIRELQLSTVFGWEIQNVEDDVNRALAEGDTTFFAAGGISCPPLEVPPEYQYLASSTHTIYCGCVVRQRSEEESARQKHQLAYAKAYNRVLLGKLTARPHSTPEYVLEQLPSLSDIKDAHRFLRESNIQVISREGFNRTFVDTPEGNAAERAILAEWNKQSGAQHPALGIFSLPWGSWRNEGVEFPAVVSSYRNDQDNQHTSVTAYQSELDGQRVTITAINSVYDDQEQNAHITLLLERGDAVGWGLLTVAADYSAISGTLYIEGAYYRIMTYPGHEGPQLILRSPIEDQETLAGQLLLVAGQESDIGAVEERHQGIAALWVSQQHQ